MIQNNMYTTKSLAHIFKATQRTIINHINRGTFDKGTVETVGKQHVVFITRKQLDAVIEKWPELTRAGRRKE
jgi:hypothetical protein